MPDVFIPLGVSRTNTFSPYYPPSLFKDFFKAGLGFKCKYSSEFQLVYI